MKKLWLLHFSSHIRDFSEAVLWCFHIPVRPPEWFQLFCTHTVCPVWLKVSAACFYLLSSDLHHPHSHPSHTLQPHQHWLHLHWLMEHNMNLWRLKHCPVKHLPVTTPLLSAFKWTLLKSVTSVWSQKEKLLFSRLERHNISESTQTSSHLSSDTSWTFRN